MDVRTMRKDQPPLKDHALWYHLHPVKFIGVGPMGTWLQALEGPERYLAQGRCVARKPFYGPQPCPWCGWTFKVDIKMEDHENP